MADNRNDKWSHLFTDQADRDRFEQDLPSWYLWPGSERQFQRALRRYRKGLDVDGGWFAKRWFPAVMWALAIVGAIHLTLALGLLLTAAANG